MFVRASCNDLRIRNLDGEHHMTEEQIMQAVQRNRKDYSYVIRSVTRRCKENINWIRNRTSLNDIIYRIKKIFCKGNAGLNDQRRAEINDGPLQDGTVN